MTEFYLNNDVNYLRHFWVSQASCIGPLNLSETGHIDVSEVNNVLDKQCQ